MNRTFRRNHGAKPRSTSSTFISLHFNKADEDQLEISYKDDKKAKEDVMSKSASEIPQSNLKFYTQETQKDDSAESSSKEACSNEDESILTSDSFKSYWPHVNKKANSVDQILEESIKSKSFKTAERLKGAECAKSDANDIVKSVLGQSDEVDSQVLFADSVSSDSQLKLSPAIEAAEIEDNYGFNHYINDKLERAKCEIIDVKKETPPSFSSLSQKGLKDDLSSLNNQDLETREEHSKCKTSEVDGKKSPKHNGHFYNVITQGIDLMKYAKNTVRFHIFIAVFACLCAPIPSWLSGFLVGMILAGSLVYWLYKPQKNKKHFYKLPQNFKIAKSQEESGILKGWMNELPSFMSYDPEKYHVSSTRSVYVRLDGSYLRFSFPQKNISKRAMFNEPRHEMQFIHQQHYDIADAIVELQPKGLTNKRLWSKKYPICLKISNSKDAILSNPSKTQSTEASFSVKTNKKDNSCKKFSPRINENNEIVIYLFSRTDRDKTLWYYRFKKASKSNVARSNSPALSTRITESDSLENKRTMSLDFAFLQSGSSLQNEEYYLRGDDETDDSFVELNLSKQQKFEMYMSALLAPLKVEYPFALSLKKDKGAKGTLTQSNLTWVNVMIGRLFFDFLVEDMWAQLVTEKIQKKLNRLKLPFFLSELIVKDINLGSTLPKIHHASDPSIDEQGLWIDIDLSYNGSFHMTLETKLNLCRFKADSEESSISLSKVLKQNEASEQPTKPSAYNSEEDSMESSSDDESLLPEVNEDGSPKDATTSVSSSGSTSKKFLKFVDRVAQSPYFQHAAKNKYIKKAMDDLSNTPLVLTVEVQYLTGTLAINIPPWPTDRLWYGFRTNPSLSITARPKLGQHVVTFTQVTEWIEKKLVSEFQKLLVMPNMDDLIIPIMQPCDDVPQMVQEKGV